MMMQPKEVKEHRTSMHSFACNVDGCTASKGMSNSQFIDLLKNTQEALEKLKEWSPDLVDHQLFCRDPKAERIEQLLQSLEPQLQGTRHSWWTAMDQLAGPVKDLQELVDKTDLTEAEEAVKQLRRSGLSDKEAAGLGAQSVHCIHALHSRACRASSHIAAYETKAQELYHLKDRAAVCLRADEIIRHCT